MIKQATAHSDYLDEKKNNARENEWKNLRARDCQIESTTDQSSVV